MRLFAIAMVVAFAAGCGASTPPPSIAPSPDPVGKGQGAGQRASLTAAECEARGGKVVGDIGDGAIHRPEYVCPQTGKAPIGDIAAAPGGPIAVEGAVCCG